MDLDNIFHRQLDILHPNDIREKVGIIGVGGIGSPTALVLTKMGIPDLTYWDDDNVEIHNLPNQLFRVEDMGNNKVNALTGLLREFGFEGQRTNGERKRWDGDIKDIMICAVDSMDTRIAIWEKIKNNRNCKLYVDGRMGAELMKIYAINPNSDEDVKFYERTLYPSSEAVELPCNARATFYNAFIIAGLIGSQVKKHLKDEKNTREIMFDLPSLFFSKSSDK